MKRLFLCLTLVFIFYGCSATDQALNVTKTQLEASTEKAIQADVKETFTHLSEVLRHLPSMKTDLDRAFLQGRIDGALADTCYFISEENPYVATQYKIALTQFSDNEKAFLLRLKIFVAPNKHDEIKPYLGELEKLQRAAENIETGPSDQFINYSPQTFARVMELNQLLKETTLGLVNKY